MIDESRRRMLQAGMLLTPAAVRFPASAPSAAALPLDLKLAGDGRADDSASLQRVYDHVARTGGGTIALPPGRFRVQLRLHSRSVNLTGAGIGATTLIPADADGVAISADYQNGDPQSVEISDLRLAGAVAGRGTLFAAGTGSGRDAAYSGGTGFTRVGFEGAYCAIRREKGSIGLWVDRCRFDANDFHFLVRGTKLEAGASAMHGGCMNVSRSWLTNFRRAMAFIDSPTSGSGQIIFDGNIVELGAGFVFYIKAFNASLAPAIVIRDQWNEAAGTARDLEVDGRKHPRAAFLFAQAVTAPILIENTPPGHCILKAATMLTRNCDLTMLSVDSDNASSVSHEHAYAFEGTPPGVATSIAPPTQPSGLRTPWFEMPLPVARSPLWNQQVLWRSDAGQGLEIRHPKGTTTTPALGSRVAMGTAHHIDLAANADAFIGSARPASGDWLVTLYLYELGDRAGGIGPTIEINGALGVSGKGQLRAGRWRMLVGLCRIAETPPGPLGLLHRSTNAATITLGGAAILRFADLQSALDFANRGVFPG